MILGQPAEVAAGRCRSVVKNGHAVELALQLCMFGFVPILQVGQLLPRAGQLRMPGYKVGVGGLAFHRRVDGGLVSLDLLSRETKVLGDAEK